MIGKKKAHRMGDEDARTCALQVATATGRGPGLVGYDIAEGVDAMAVLFYLVVEVGKRGPPRRTDPPDDVPAAHLLSLAHEALLQMGKPGDEAVSMRQLDDLSIRAPLTRERHHTVGGREYRGALAG